MCLAEKVARLTGTPQKNARNGSKSDPFRYSSSRKVPEGFKKDGFFPNFEGPSQL